MSQALGDFSCPSPTPASAAPSCDQANSSSGIALQVRADRYASIDPTSLPTSAEIRAFRAALGEAGATPASKEAGYSLRFPGAGWTLQAMLAKSQATDAVATREVGPTRKVVEIPAAEPTNGTFNTDLWYAQTGVNLTRQKCEQLSFTAIPSKGSWTTSNDSN